MRVFSAKFTYIPPAFVGSLPFWPLQKVSTPEKMGQKTMQFHVLLPIEIMFNSWESKYLIGNNHLLEL